MSKEIDKIFILLNKYEKSLQNIDKMLKKTIKNIATIENKVNNISDFINEVLSINDSDIIEDFDDTWVPENEIWNENYIDEENNDS
jgi:hypothetical protein